MNSTISPKIENNLNLLKLSHYLYINPNYHNVMLISFFEEYPTKSNLEKLELIKFQAKLYIASSSLDKFSEIREKIKSKNIKEIIYWPILKKEEGYWYSPFSKRSAMIRTLKEIPDNLPVMIDLELPTTQNSNLYFTQLHNFPRNKLLISKFIKHHKNVYTAEYFPIKSWMKFLGLNYNPLKYNSKMIKMFYTSMWPFPRNFLKNEIKGYNKKYKERFIPAFGTIATGVSGSEPILSPEKLEADLEIAEQNNIKEVIIFRLGGLNKNYIRVISKFI